MTLWYNFGEEDFEYDANYPDIKEYLMNLPSEELVDPLKQAFENLPKEEQLALLDERHERNFAAPNFLNWIEEDRQWVIEEFLMDNDILELFEDELHDEFEEKAYLKYQDGKYYKRDAYSYNGLNRNDFD